MSDHHERAFVFLKKALEGEEKPTTLSPPLMAILQNAWRLLDDAGLLYENERFASATALAILAMEEKGKYLMVKWASEEGSVARDLNDHIVKQFRFASLTFSDVFLAELEKQLDRRGLVIKHRSQITEQERQWADAQPDGASIAQLGKNKRFIEMVMEHVLENEDAKLITRVQRREINKLKQRCMYVDVNNSFEVLSDPGDITRETASYFLRLARRFIGRPDNRDGSRMCEGPPLGAGGPCSGAGAAS